MLNARCVLIGSLVVATLTVVVGCGSKLGTPVKVSGKVTVDDKPLANAIVTLVFNGEREAEFRSFQTTAGAGGEYEFPAVYPGDYTVTATEALGAPGATENLGNQSAISSPMVPVGGPDLKLTVAQAPATFDIKMTKGK